MEVTSVSFSKNLNSLSWTIKEGGAIGFFDRCVRGVEVSMNGLMESSSACERFFFKAYSADAITTSFEMGLR